MERTTLYQDDLTEERMVTPAKRDDVSQTQAMDPDVAGDADGEDVVEDDDDDDDDDDEDEDLED